MVFILVEIDNLRLICDIRSVIILGVSFRRKKPVTNNQPKAAVPSVLRRRSDTIMSAFEQACDSRRIAIATDLFDLLEQELYRENTYPGAERRNSSDVLPVAEARLRALRAVSTPSCSNICSAAAISMALSAGRGSLNETGLNANVA